MHSSAHKTAYEILGVAATATQSEIHAKMRQHAFDFHPDRVPASQREFAINQFHAVMDAYNKVRDAATRAKYDASLQPRPKKTHNNQAISTWIQTLETVFWPFKK